MPRSLMKLICFYYNFGICSRRSTAKIILLIKKRAFLASIMEYVFRFPTFLFQNHTIVSLSARTFRITATRATCGYKWQMSELSSISISIHHQAYHLCAAAAQCRSALHGFIHKTAPTSAQSALTLARERQNGVRNHYTNY